jgi:hypothetical protein
MNLLILSMQVLISFGLSAVAASFGESARGCILQSTRLQRKVAAFRARSAHSGMSLEGEGVKVMRGKVGSGVGLVWGSLVLDDWLFSDARPAVVEGVILGRV